MSSVVKHAVALQVLLTGLAYSGTGAAASVLESLKRVGAEPRVSTPAEFREQIAKDWKSYGEAIRVANLTVN